MQLGCCLRILVSYLQVQAASRGNKTLLSLSGFPKRAGRSHGVFFCTRFILHSQRTASRNQLPGALCGTLRGIRLAERDAAVSVAEDLIACVEIKFRTPHAIDATSSP